MAGINFGVWVTNRLASLVSFSNVGTDLISTTVQAALAELAGRNFGKNYGYLEDEIGLATASGTFVNAQTLTLPAAPGGTYRVGYSYHQTNSKSNTSGEVQISVDGVEIRLTTACAQVDNEVAAFKGDISHVSGDLTVELNIRRTSGNGNAIAEEIHLEAWRIT